MPNLKLAKTIEFKARETVLARAVSHYYVVRVLPDLGPRSSYRYFDDFFELEDLEEWPVLVCYATGYNKSEAERHAEALRKALKASKHPALANSVEVVRIDYTETYAEVREEEQEEPNHGKNQEEH